MPAPVGQPEAFPGIQQARRGSTGGQPITSQRNWIPDSVSVDWSTKTGSKVRPKYPQNQQISSVGNIFNYHCYYETMMQKVTQWPLATFCNSPDCDANVAEMERVRRNSEGGEEGL